MFVSKVIEETNSSVIKVTRTILKYTVVYKDAVLGLTTSNWNAGTKTVMTKGVIEATFNDLLDLKIYDTLYYDVKSGITTNKTDYVFGSVKEIISKQKAGCLSENYKAVPYTNIRALIYVDCCIKAKEERKGNPVKSDEDKTQRNTKSDKVSNEVPVNNV